MHLLRVGRDDRERTKQAAIGRAKRNIRGNSALAIGTSFRYIPLLWPERTRCRAETFEVSLTVDEELSALDEALRRLKVEYDVYFGGGAKKPPVDTEWRVSSLMKKFSDSQKLNFGQRFRYNTIVQRYAVMSELWRQKLKIREEGYRRPQDALLAIQGLRTDEEHAAAAALNSRSKHRNASQPGFVVDCADVQADRAKVEALFNALVEAKRLAGEVAPAAKFDSFLAFVGKKTEQIRRECGCPAVEYRVEVHGGRVALKARAKGSASRH